MIRGRHLLGIDYFVGQAFSLTPRSPTTGELQFTICRSTSVSPTHFL